MSSLTSDIPALSASAAPALASSDAFVSFITPPPSARYTSNYYTQMTFASALTESQVQPKILPRYSLLEPPTFFHQTLPISPSNNSKEEYVLHEKDLETMDNSELRKKYDEGYRSMQFSYSIPGVSATFVTQIHFAKWTIFRSINCNMKRVDRAAALFTHILDHLHLPKQFIEKIGQLPISADLAGLKSKAKLLDLDCLLEEHYLWEEILDAAIETLWLRYSIGFPLSESPPIVPLPTSFYPVLEHCCKNKQLESKLSSELKDLQLTLNSAKGYLFAVTRGSHFTGYAHMLGATSLQFCDGLHGTPMTKIVRTVGSFTSGLCSDLPWRIVDDCETVQPAGSGSCGVILLNWMGRKLSLTANLWSHEASSEFRNEILKIFIVLHVLSQEHLEQGTGDDNDWWQLHPGLSPVGILSEVEDLNSYKYPRFNDFTKFRPTEYHPVHLLDLVLKSAQPSNDNSDSDTSSFILDISSDEQQVDVKFEGYSQSSKLNIDNKHYSIGCASRLKPVVTCQPPVQKVIEILDSSDHEKQARLNGHPHRKTATQNTQVIEILDSDSEGDDTREADSSRPPIGLTFESFEDAIQTIYNYEEQCGHKFVRSQSKKATDGGPPKKYMLRCSAYRAPKHVKDIKIDPSDHRKGRSVRTNCPAHVNINRTLGTDIWTLTHAIWKHNHPSIIPVGGRAQRPATEKQKRLVADLAMGTRFQRKQIKHIMSLDRSDRPLEDRQVTNLMNKIHRDADDEVSRLGGDIMSVVNELRSRQDVGELWKWHIASDSDGRVKVLFWMSPQQVMLAKRYSDILLNDNSYSRNKYAYPLNIGIIIDGHGVSRNVFYALQADESSESHEIIFQQYLSVVGNSLEVLATDRHPSLIKAAGKVLPTVDHIYCIWHIRSNIMDAVRPQLRDRTQTFLSDLWKVYSEPSPEQFDTAWASLTKLYPECADYLNSHIYPCRERWAWTFISQVFTCGVRSTARIEGENRYSKVFTGPKTNFLGLFKKLNDRTKEQQESELIAARQSSRRRLNNNVETVFPKPLALLRKYCGPFALTHIYEQLEKAPFYRVEAVQLSPGETWSGLTDLPEYQDHYFIDHSKQKSNIDTFAADEPFVAPSYLFQLIFERGLRVRNVYSARHQGGTTTVHLVIVLQDGRFLCDCCMGQNLGLPCRHFFAVMMNSQIVRFHIGCIRRRWLQDPKLDTSIIPPVSRSHTVVEEESNPTLPATFFANPLGPHRQQGSSPDRNSTVPPHEIYHTANVAMRDLIRHISTQEQLDGLIGQMNGLANQRNNLRPEFVDPQPKFIRGRPRTSRLAASSEGTRSTGNKAPRSKKKSSTNGNSSILPGSAQMSVACSNLDTSQPSNTNMDQPVRQFSGPDKDTLLQMTTPQSAPPPADFATWTQTRNPLQPIQADSQLPTYGEHLQSHQTYKPGPAAPTNQSSQGVKRTIGMVGGDAADGDVADGGRAQKKSRLCGLCREPGHTRRGCAIAREVADLQRVLGPVRELRGRVC